MLSTFVKLAYKHGFTTAEVTISQFFWGVFILTAMSVFGQNRTTRVSSSDALKLATAGLSTGFTSVLYYVSVKYIDASVAVVLLMQSVWIGVVIETIQTRKWPSFGKVASVLLVLFGTLLAANSLGSHAQTHAIDVRGLIFGLLAAFSFSMTLFTSNSVAAHLPPVKRSQFMIYGGSLVVIIFGFLTQIGPYYFNVQLIGSQFIQSQPLNISILLTYGLFLSVFGTVIPPLMLNRGFPIVGVGLGSILASLELPCAMLVAFLLLGERMAALQWVGVVAILGAVVLLNYKLIRITR